MNVVRLLLYSSLIAALGCMPKIEDDVGIAKPIVTNHSISALNAIDHDVLLYGSCPKEVTKLYISVDGDSYSEANSSASPRTVGVASGTCVNGSFTVTYPVPNPMVSRTIQFKIRGANTDGRQGEYVLYNVAYNKAVSAMPGFAIVSLGGLATGGAGSNFFLTSGGQPVTNHLAPAVGNGVTVDSPNYKIHYGLIGILLE